jgi:hypothetical protein
VSLRLRRGYPDKTDDCHGEQKMGYGRDAAPKNQQALKRTMTFVEEGSLALRLLSHSESPL